MRIHSGLRCIGCGMILMGMRDVFAASTSLTPAIFLLTISVMVVLIFL